MRLLLLNFRQIRNYFRNSWMLNKKFTIQEF